MIERISKAVGSTNTTVDTSKILKTTSSVSYGAWNIRSVLTNFFTKLGDRFTSEIQTAINERSITDLNPVLSSSFIEDFYRSDLLGQYQGDLGMEVPEGEIKRIFSRTYADLATHTVNNESNVIQLFFDIQRKFVELRLQSGKEPYVIINRTHKLEVQVATVPLRSKADLLCAEPFKKIEEFLVQKKVSQDAIKYHRERMICFFHQGALAVHCQIAALLMKDYVVFLQEKYKNVDRPLISIFGEQPVQSLSGAGMKNQYYIFVPGNCKDGFVRTDFVTNESCENVFVKVGYTAPVNLLDSNSKVIASKKLNIIVCFEYFVNTDQPKSPVLKVVALQDITDPENQTQSLVLNF